MFRLYNWKSGINKSPNLLRYLPQVFVIAVLCKHSFIYTFTNEYLFTIFRVWTQEGFRHPRAIQQNNRGYFFDKKYGETKMYFFNRWQNLHYTVQWTIQDLQMSGKESFELFTCLFVWFGLYCYFFQFWQLNTGPWAMFPRSWFCMCHCCLRWTFISPTLTSNSLLWSWAWPWTSNPLVSPGQVLRLQQCDTGI